MKRFVVIGVVGFLLVLAFGFNAWRSRERKDDATPAADRFLPEPSTAAPPTASGAALSRAEPKSSEPKTPPLTSPLVRPSFDVVRIGPQAQAVIAGRAAPDALVTVLDNGKPIGSVKADRRGEWVLLPDKPLATGVRELSLSAQHNGQEPISAEKVVVLSISPASPPSALDSNAPPTNALAILVPDKGAGPSTPLQIPPPTASPTPPPTAQANANDKNADDKSALTFDVVDYSAEGNVSFAGQGEIGNIVRFYLDNRWVGESLVDAQGRWRGQANQAIEAGRYRLRLDQLNDKNRVTARVEVPFQHSPIDLKSFKENNRLVVQPGNSLWRIARKTYGSGIQYTVIYQSNRDRIRDPDLIYPGQVFHIP